MVKIYWLFGRSGSGKTTLAEAFLRQKDMSNEMWKHIDANQIRLTLNSDLDYEVDHMREHLRRGLELVRMYADEDVNVIASFITPTFNDRLEVLKKLPEVEFFYCKCSIKIAKLRSNGKWKGKFFCPTKSETFRKINTQSISVLESLKLLLYGGYFGLFVGRYAPFTEDDKALIKSTCHRYNIQPLILLRDSIEADLPELTTYHRSMKLWNWLQKEFEHGKVMIIPDIQGFFYGSEVGFPIKKIDMDKE